MAAKESRVTLPNLTPTPGLDHAPPGPNDDDGIGGSSGNGSAPQLLSGAKPQAAPPSVFDLFYEEFLMGLMGDKDLSDRVPNEFMSLQSDYERVQYLSSLSPIMRDFEIKAKLGTKSLERSIKFREEGNKLFQADQTVQAVLFYNKAIVYAPHPSAEEYLRPAAVLTSSSCTPRSTTTSGANTLAPNPSPASLDSPVLHLRKQSGPSKYEALALCYANRSAALRRLCQYEECLQDISRAAKFGYPRENVHKLWERKGKCYHGLKRFELAIKCLREAIQSLKEATRMSESQRAMKLHELQSLLKEWRNAQMVMQMASEMSSSSPATTTTTTPPDLPPASLPGDEVKAAAEDQQQLMGATGPLVPMKEAQPFKKKSAVQPPVVASPPSASAANAPPAVPSPAIASSGLLSPAETKLHAKPPSFHKKDKLQATTTHQAPLATGGPSPPLTAAQEKQPRYFSSDQGIPHLQKVGQAGFFEDMSSNFRHHQTSPTPSLQKSNSLLSISQMSSTGIVKPEVEVPELSYGPHPRIPKASSAIELRFSPEKGRHFVALQDLFPGDVVLREKPYAAVLEAIFRVNHCAYCLKKTPTPIPCFECSTVQFCGEVCRDLAWNEYHSIECGILAYLEPSRYLGRMPHLALRIITKTGMQSLIQHSSADSGGIIDMYDHNSFHHHHHHHHHLQRQQEPQPTFDPSSYRSVHNLALNSDKRPFEDMVRKTAEAVFMARCLRFNGFFGDPCDRSPDAQRAEMFVSGLVLRHLQVTATNGLEMAECILKNNDVTKFDIIPVGGAIFPTMSFFNHSCYPNALRLGYQNFQVIRIIRTVRQGEEVTIDYGFDFYANPKEVRQRRADHQYHFVCKCPACMGNWPTYNELTRVRPDSRYRCEITGALAGEIDRHHQRYQLGMELLVRLDVAKAMPLFREYLLFMNEVVQHPDRRYIDCEEAYKQCLWLENRGYKPRADSTPKTFFGMPATPSWSTFGPSSSELS